MGLNNLKLPSGARKNKKRVGRGEGSGHGKTACKGQKGQNSRSGGKVPPWFEGGQMPLQRRVPKRGFTNIFRKEYAIVNLRDLEPFPAGQVVTPALLKEKRIIKKLKAGLKILGKGDLRKPLEVEAHKFSQSALKKISDAGGKARVV
mgnify:CR=1 FL=1